MSIPPRSAAPDVTALLKRWQGGDTNAADELMAATYNQLRQVARGLMRSERRDHTLQATALVHEAYLRLFRGQPLDLASRQDFFRLVAAQMRHQLIDHARSRGAAKRGGGFIKADFDDVVGTVAAPESRSDEETFTRLEETVRDLEAVHPRPGRVLRLRFFAGLSIDEVAIEVEVSSATVKRDLAFARAWVARALGAR